jgi:hypothetical protein
MSIRQVLSHIPKSPVSLRALDKWAHDWLLLIHQAALRVIVWSVSQLRDAGVCLTQDG